MQGVKHFDQYFRQNKFVIVTDDMSLKWLLGTKEPKGRPARWILSLQQYNYEVQHRAVKKHNNADSLSRQPYPQTNDTHTPQDTEEVDAPLLHPGVYSLNGNETADEKTQDTVPLGIQKEELITRQTDDRYLGPMIRYLKDSVLPEDSKQARSILLQVRDFTLREGILYHFWFPHGKGAKMERAVSQLSITQNMVKYILEAMHDCLLAGHLGVAHNYGTIRLRYFWKNISADIKNYLM